ncbi:MAG: DUF262 domain-containing protein [Dehalococcoidia bacterium]|nr:DUF262 domain-containing protein [Dehalococcoidia bacterium]
MTVKIEQIKSERDDAEEDVSRYKIAAYPADYTLQGLYDKWISEEIFVPPFQRRFVWTINQASSLIESFLLGLPVPPLFLYRESDTQRLLVVDGQQRLRSVFGYFAEEFPDTRQRFSLRKVKAVWEGLVFSQLNSADKIRLRDAVLRTIIIEQLDPKDNTSMYHIFKRLNTGGTTLNSQEIRNALYHGEFSKFLMELNSIPNWRVILGSAVVDKRYRDVELVLRTLALAENGDRYHKPMTDFLTDFMKENRNNKERFEKYRSNFEGAVNYVVETLDSKPFHRQRGLNAAICDSVMVAFYHNLLNRKLDLREQYRKLLNNDSFDRYVSSSTTDVDTVKQRIKLAQQGLFG